MPRQAQYSKAGLVERLLPVFEHYGFEGASLARLAEASGLSKASLYHHFPAGKVDMARHVLAYMGARLQKLILLPLTQDDPADAINKSLDGVLKYYSGDVPSCLMNSLLIGEGQQLYGDDVQGAFTVWASQLANVLHQHQDIDSASANTIATQALEQIQGALIICRVQQSRIPLEASITALKNQLLTG